MKKSFVSLSIVSLICVILLQAGCGALYVERTTFPNTGVGGEGQGITYDQINDIVNDSSLTTDEKREELRELGIEDEDLIEALL